ncbi:MAG: GTPase RsgA [Myxococcales bacterium]|nr:GTPase RsgA [Myxococcales bacterium]
MTNKSDTTAPPWLITWGLAAPDHAAMTAAGWPWPHVARIISEHRGIYTLACESGERLGRVAGKLRMRDSATAQETPGFPVVGDWVLLDEDGSGEFAAISHALPRRALLRRARPSKELQLIAANIDLVLIIAASDGVAVRQRVDQYAAVAAESGVPSRVAFTKIDLATPPRQGDELAICNVDGAGLAEVRAALGGKTTLLVGDSGAGKSSLLNALIGGGAHRTAQLTHGGEGRHTTTARRLVPLTVDVAPSTCVIDSPGWRHVRTEAELAIRAGDEQAAGPSSKPLRRGAKTPRTSRR